MKECNSENKLDSAKVQGAAVNKIMGSSVHFYDSVTSTNEVARNLAQKGAEEGTLVAASLQSTGRGRLERSWFSPKGGLWFSLVLRPKILPKNAPAITLMAAVAVAKSLNESYTVNATIKWPNDILIKGKKVCGILTEMRSSTMEIEYVILGIGVNVNTDFSALPKDIADRSTALHLEIKRELDLNDVLINILNELEYFYAHLNSDSIPEILQMWREYSDTIGQYVRINTICETVIGTAVDIDEDGAIMIRTNGDGIKRFTTGDCIHLSNYKGE